MSTDPQNTKVQRYDLCSPIDGEETIYVIGHVPDGDYVRFTDYAALEVKHAALLAGIDEVMSSAACLTGYSIGDAVAELQRVLKEHALTPDNFPTEKKAHGNWTPIEVNPPKAGEYLAWVQDLANIGGYVDHAEVSHWDGSNWNGPMNSACDDGCYQTYWAEINFPTEKKGGAA